MVFFFDATLPTQLTQLKGPKMDPNVDPDKDPTITIEMRIQEPSLDKKVLLKLDLNPHPLRNHLVP